MVLYYEIALYCGMLILESRPHTQKYSLKKSHGYSLGVCGYYYQVDPKEHILYSISFTCILLKKLPEEYSFVYENMNNIV